MTADIWFVIVLVAASAFFALLEIQIEGGAGWASDLPTWRFENNWTRLILGARPITGYHVCFQLFVLSLGHLGYALGVAPSLKLELRIIAFLVLFWILEDFLWFVFNPRFGLRRFRRKHIWWHAKTWWWFMPRDYWIFLPIAAALLVAARY